MCLQEHQVAAREPFPTGESPNRAGEILPCFLMLRGAVLGTVSALLSNAHPFQLLPMKPQAGLLFEPKISPYGATVFFF